MNITGYVFPWDGNQPVYVSVEGSIFLMMFSTGEKLRAFMTESGLPYVSIKKIDDQVEFLSSFPPELGLRMMVDPWITEDRNTRFKELFVPIH